MKESDEKEDGDEMKESVVMESRVSVYQHEGEFSENKKTEENTIIKDVPNKFVDNSLVHLRAILIIENTGDISGTISPWDMYIGTSDAQTTSGMTALQSPIGTGDGTSPDVLSGDGTKEIETGKWQIKYVATWYSGSVSGTVEEIGLYLRLFDEDVSFETGSPSQAYGLSNRLSTGDGEFSSFTIDDSKSLTIEWRVIYDFE